MNLVSLLRKPTMALAALALLTGTVGGSIMQTPAHVHADETWCWDDPVISVNGIIYDVSVFAQTSNPALAGTVTLTIPVPVGATVKVLYTTTLNFPQNVVFAYNGGNPFQSTSVSSTGVPTKVLVLGGFAIPTPD